MEVPLMPDLSLEKIAPEAAQRIRPFLEEILRQYSNRVHSIHVTGTSVTEDFHPKTSDVNTIFVLKEMDLKFLELIAPLGRKYGKQKVAAPLIMTPSYVENSLDVFPVEFMNFKLIHETVYGDDILREIEIAMTDLRHQCERELKTKLIWLRQGYLSSAGNRKILTENFASSISGYIPLFRGIIRLLGIDPPLKQHEVISALSVATGVDTAAFARVLREKHEQGTFSVEELNTIFEEYYAATEKLGRIVDEITL
jgi:hypothetical protein